MTLVSLPTSNSEEFREFATRLFNSWGIGNAQRDNGVLILLIRCKANLSLHVPALTCPLYDRENRRFDVVTGTGLSTVLPPSWLDEFQNSELTGPLRRGDYSMVRNLFLQLLLPGDILLQLSLNCSVVLGSDQDGGGDQ